MVGATTTIYRVVFCLVVLLEGGGGGGGGECDKGMKTIGFRSKKEGIGRE